MSIPKNKKTYNKVVAFVKSRVNRWPSAYASGMVVKRYKNIMAKRGQQAYTNKPGTLSRWFKEKWVDIKTGKPCGSVKSKGYYPTCRPLKRINKGTPVTLGEMKKKQINKMIRQKQVAKSKRVLNTLHRRNQ